VSLTAYDFGVGGIMTYNENADNTTYIVFVRRELNRIRHRLKRALVKGDRSTLDYIAKDIILLEIEALNRGVLDDVKSELLELKQIYVRAYIVSRIANFNVERLSWGLKNVGKRRTTHRT